MSLVNAFTHNRSSNTHNRSSNTHCVVLMAQVHSVTLLPIENPLSHDNRHLLEKAINFEQQGFFTTPHILQTLHHMVSNLMESFYCRPWNINYLIFSSHFHHIFIIFTPLSCQNSNCNFYVFSTWLLIKFG